MGTYGINVEELFIQIRHNIENNDNNTVNFTRSLLDIPPTPGYTSKNMRLNQQPYYTDTVLYPLDTLNLMNYQERVNFFFNKDEFIYILRDIEQVKPNAESNSNYENTIANQNIKIMLETLFPTHPSVRNIKTTYKTDILKASQLKPLMVLPWKSYLYSYLNVQGTKYTISGVTWVNDFTSHPDYIRLIESYTKFKGVVGKLTERLNIQLKLKEKLLPEELKEENDIQIKANNVEIENLKTKNTETKNNNNKQIKVFRDKLNTITKEREKSITDIINQNNDVLQLFYKNVMADVNESNNLSEITGIPFKKFVEDIERIKTNEVNADLIDLLEQTKNLLDNANSLEWSGRTRRPIKNKNWNNYTVSHNEINGIILNQPKLKQTESDIVFVDYLTHIIDIISQMQKNILEQDKTINETKQNIEDLKQIISKYESEMNAKILIITNKTKTTNESSNEINTIKTKIDCLSNIFKMNEETLIKKYKVIFGYNRQSDIYNEYRIFKNVLEEYVDSYNRFKYKASNPELQILMDDQINNQSTKPLYETFDLIQKYYIDNKTKPVDTNIAKKLHPYLYVGIVFKPKQYTIVINMDLSTTIYKDTDSYISDCKTTSEKLGMLADPTHSTYNNLPQQPKNDLPQQSNMNLPQQPNTNNRNLPQQQPQNSAYVPDLKHLVQEIMKHKKYTKVQEFFKKNQILNINIEQIIKNEGEVMKIISDIENNPRMIESIKVNLLRRINNQKFKFESIIQDTDIRLNQQDIVQDQNILDKYHSYWYVNSILVIALDILNKRISPNQSGGIKNRITKNKRQIYNKTHKTKK
jgi:hypothetical protein